MTADTRDRLAALLHEALADGPAKWTHECDCPALADRLIAAGFGDVAALTAEVARLREQNDALYAAVQMGAKEQTRLREAMGQIESLCRIIASLDPEREP